MRTGLPAATTSGERLSELRKPRAGNLDGGGKQARPTRRLARLLVEVRRGAGDERAPVLAAEPAREDAEAVRHRDLVDDLAAGGDAAERARERVGRPDVLLGVERAAGGREGAGSEHGLRVCGLGRELDLSPDAAIGQRTVELDREGAEAGGEG